MNTRTAQTTVHIYTDEDGNEGFLPEEGDIQEARRVIAELRQEAQAIPETTEKDRSRKQRALRWIAAGERMLVSMQATRDRWLPHAVELTFTLKLPTQEALEAAIRASTWTSRDGSLTCVDDLALSQRLLPHSLANMTPEEVEGLDYPLGCVLWQRLRRLLPTITPLLPQDAV
ncbi:MAG TPA: hypothetical protein VFB38_05440 [Chthonomonadaceae bacterium]|nr:hypothetical protein [Chthonomonadaceae bacterium]